MAPTGAIRTGYDGYRDGSMEHTSYGLGRCCYTEAEWRHLRTPPLPSIGLQLYHVTQQADICSSLPTIPVSPYYTQI